MSDPTRYEVEGCMEPSRKGDFVMWSDYAKLKAENERLRKAGTYLVSTSEVNGISADGDIKMHERALAFWRETAKGLRS